MSASLGRGGIAEWWGAVSGVSTMCGVSGCLKGCLIQNPKCRLLLSFAMFPSLALALIPSVAFACVGSACCFRLRRFHLLRSFALVPSVALVCVGSVCCFRLHSSPLLL